MTIHVSPTTQCNLGCSYCYEEPDREVSDVDSDYDIDAIMERLREWKERYPNQSPGMHGGEPLLMKDEDLEKVFSFAYENWGSSHIQTNGTLVTEDIIEMFEKYNVHVGVSKDGPKELNQRRLARSGGEDATDLMTERTEQTIHDIVESDASVGVIVVLHKYNAGDDEKLEKLLDWMDYLNKHGVSGHFNPAIPYEDVQADESLSPERLKEVYLRTWEWLKEEPYREWNPMRDYQDNLLANQLGNCVNVECDVFNAQAAQIVKGDGSTTGCGKTWSSAGDGNAFLQGDSTGNDYEETRERYEMLKQIPGVHGDEPDQGGCHGCKFWNVCRGGCPSAGKDFDFRNRTRWCEAKYALYNQIEKDMRVMFPGIRLVTDLPWDAPIGEDLKRGNVNLEPFAEMTKSKSREPSVTGGDAEQADPLWRFEINDKDFDEKVQYLKKEYGRDNVSGDKQSGSIHVDSAQNPQENKNKFKKNLQKEVSKMSFDEKVEYLKHKFGGENIKSIPEEEKVEINPQALREASEVVSEENSVEQGEVGRGTGNCKCGEDDCGCKDSEEPCSCS